MQVDIFKCFIASPGDTVKEREICDQVFEEINLTLGKTFNFRIESLRWERDSRPSFGEDGQDIINKQLFNNIDLFIGIMWSRFGSETKRAGSGTEEEFNLAFDKFKSGEKIQIMIYFNDEQVSPSKINIDQMKKVLEFKDKVRNLGGLYHEYIGEIEFKEKLKNHIYSHFNEFYKNKKSIDSSNAVQSNSDEILSEAIQIILKNRLNEALSSYSDQPIIWIEPVLSRTNKISSNIDKNFNNKVDLLDIIQTPKSMIIKSPPQFGLTCLSHYLVFEAWKRNSVWVYLDAKKIRVDQVEKSVNKALNELNLNGVKANCIILDSWRNTDPGAMKILRGLNAAFTSIPIIVMQTIEESHFLVDEENGQINRHFDVLYLIALPRHQIRQFISAYNLEKQIGDEEKILTKVVDDLDVLNIHRTPHNCLTLLKVFETYFDESPVNRTRMLDLVLQILFDCGDIPSYKSKPDIKDCEFVLGAFCEILIRNGNFEFAHDFFIESVNSICSNKLIYLDCELVFKILHDNKIIITKDKVFIFKASYWIYYFAAKRMYVDKEFCSFLLSNERYANFPEIVEFYTGIDRNREDLLELLYLDIKTTNEVVQKKTGLSSDINPLKSLEWKPSKENLEKLQSEICGDVLKSNLPSVVKDQYADKGYNQLKPYDQSIQAIFQDYSLANLWQKICACSRALRNSDYVNPDMKRKLLSEILKGWEEVSKILFALSPVLAARGHAAFEGRNFNLSDGFKGTQEEIVKQIYLVIPHNVVNFFQNDIFSQKLGPLLFDAISNEKNLLLKHQLILLIIYERPHGWKIVVERYMDQLPFNTFYLANVVSTLRTTYMFDFVSKNDLEDLAYLLKLGYAKYEFEVNKPSSGYLKKISNKVIPKREFDRVVHNQELIHSSSNDKED